MIWSFSNETFISRSIQIIQYLKHNEIKTIALTYNECASSHMPFPLVNQGIISLFYYSKLDFSQLLHAFCSSSVSNKVLGYNDETLPIHDLCYSFHDKNCMEDITLNKKWEGYFKFFFVTHINIKKYLDISSYFSWLLLFCIWLMKGNLVQGMMIGTAWNLLSQYVVLISNSHNLQRWNFYWIQFQLSWRLWNLQWLFLNIQWCLLISYTDLYNKDQVRPLHDVVINQGMEHIWFWDIFLLAMENENFPAKLAI